LAELPYYTCLRGQVAGIDTLTSRTGYTGENGFELYLSQKYTEQLLTEGKEFDIRPTGLGARGTLRLEMGYALYGNDIPQQTTPSETRLGWLVKWDKGEFIERKSLQRQKAEGVKRKLAGFEMRKRGIPRPGCRLWSGGHPIGEVTSGNFSPSLDKAIGLGGYIDAESEAIGTPLEVEIRDRRA
jgi:aminomethyltransferase